MSNGKISGSNPFNPIPIPINNAADPLQDPALRQATHGHHGHFKGALFRHGELSIPMRRGPIGRMPLRNAGSKRSVKAKRTPRAQDVEDHDFLQDQDQDQYRIEESSAEQLARRFKSFQSKQEEESGREGSGERRFARMFDMRASTAVDGVERKTGISTEQAKHAALANVPLPSMASLGDVVKFVHACVEKDPTGKSVPHVMRRINAAVLRKEIDVPVVTKIADARRVLIDIFGVGHLSKDSASPSMRNIHLMLPLWLINLGRQRTNEQRLQAAARLSSQRAVFDVK